MNILSPPPPSRTSNLIVKNTMVAMNEALILGSIRQHELTEAAESMNSRLEMEIAERKQVESCLRISETRYRRLFEAASDGILLVNPVSGKITDANPQMTRLSGRPRNQLIGSVLSQSGLFGNPAEIDRLLAKLEHVPEIRFDQLPLDHRDGLRQTVEVVAIFYRENDHSVVKINCRDITERKNAENAQRRFDVMEASHIKLKQEIVRRQAVEEHLHQTQLKQIQLLKQSRKQEQQLRDLSHAILHAQEDERKRISRELHDVISQNLIGINVSIATLASEDPAADPENFRRKIDKTQRIVEESLQRVHHFACELRPALLDDLGLIPALHSHLERFMKETGIRASLSAFARIEQANGDMRTALYRIAQEALANVSHHAHASQVAISIVTLDGVVVMEIKDDGSGFEITSKSHAAKKHRLGLLGMKERIEMVGGCFQIESRPGHGTTVRVAVTNLSPFTQ